MKVTLIQHTSVDSPGVTTDLLESYKVESEVIRIDRDDSVPTQVDSDVLMTFGAPVSLHSPNLPPWVNQERELIRQYAASGRRVFGICFGSQLIASALGATTHRNLEPEFGWHPVYRTDQASSSPHASRLPEKTTAFHWHQNTFALPTGATHLFQSDACDHQAFCIEDQIVAFQFHPETTAKTVDYYLRFAKPEGVLGSYVQSSEEIQQGIQKHLEDQNEMLRQFLSSWLFS